MAEGVGATRDCRRGAEFDSRYVPLTQTEYVGAHGCAPEFTDLMKSHHKRMGHRLNSPLSRGVDSCEAGRRGVFFDSQSDLMKTHPRELLRNPTTCRSEEREARRRISNSFPITAWRFFASLRMTPPTDAPPLFQHSPSGEAPTPRHDNKDWAWHTKPLRFN